MDELNEWTGRTDKWLAERHASLVERWRAIREDDEGSGGGSPGEHIMEEIDAIEAEMWRRGMGKPH